MQPPLNPFIIAIFSLFLQYVIAKKKNSYHIFFLSQQFFETCQLFDNDDFMERIVVVYCLRQEVHIKSLKK